MVGTAEVAGAVADAVADAGAVSRDSPRARARRALTPEVRGTQRSLRSTACDLAVRVGESLAAPRGQRRTTALTPLNASQPPRTHGPATMTGSSGWCTTSVRFFPILELSPWWLNSAWTPVSVTRLSGRPRRIEPTKLS